MENTRTLEEILSEKLERRVSKYLVQDHLDLIKTMSDKELMGCTTQDQFWLICTQALKRDFTYCMKLVLCNPYKARLAYQLLQVYSSCCGEDCEEEEDKLRLLLVLNRSITNNQMSYVLNSFFKKGLKWLVKVLLANGASLDCVIIKSSCFEISRDLVQFKNGVNQCRDVIITLLGLKKWRQCGHLKNLDRFLIKTLLAVEIWSTRESEEWQKLYNCHVNAI